MLDDSLKDAIAGGAAGFASSLVVAPLDVVKTRKQARKARMSVNGSSALGAVEGTLGSIQKIFINEGIPGLYRGVGPMMLGYLPSWSIYFVVYEKSKELLGVNKRSPLQQNLDSKAKAVSTIEDADPELYNFWFRQTASAIIAGAASVTFTNPIWVVKTRIVTQPHPKANPLAENVAAATNLQFRNLQTDAQSCVRRLPLFWLKRRINYNNTSDPVHFGQPTGPACSPNYKNTLDAFQKIYKYEGIKAFYRGLTPSLFGTLHVGIQFPLYEYIKSSFDDFFETQRNIHIILAATLSKITASAITYPHEVLRTRLQSLDAPTHNSMALLIRDIWRMEGWRKYYAGMGTNFLRTIPASSVTILSFEIVRDYLD
ncbi:NAD transporter [Schizosaccharomyces cryophilus OY26]|uniref:NAD transporter n=1 Tax=Schizosaccharomyces cryophilus (strain OY26 / ATCC MYA-4695 / CBS 11777 / NBRC 106824 / NRRL Y48691) TaxID=653667 RepID=S9VTZ3_SCHCR|nr:NAD transporter [Schizosaccharomyces cryophilus OY26]EPY49654.1 NAD transporter [Schizosaccharomyces cryophilus OY26]